MLDKTFTRNNFYTRMILYSALYTAHGCYHIIQYVHIVYTHIFPEFNSLGRRHLPFVLPAQAFPSLHQTTQILKLVRALLLVAGPIAVTVATAGTAGGLREEVSAPTGAGKAPRVTARPSRCKGGPCPLPAVAPTCLCRCPVPSELPLLSPPRCLL